MTCKRMVVHPIILLGTARFGVIKHIYLQVFIQIDIEVETFKNIKSRHELIIPIPRGANIGVLDIDAECSILQLVFDRHGPIIETSHAYRMFRDMPARFETL